MTQEQKELILKQLDNINNIGELSDGFHTFDALYHQRLVLFATIVNTHRGLCWKSYKHEDGNLCFGGGWFIVGIDTPDGPYTYHYENKYWDMFYCKELEVAPHWDGHTDKDVMRLTSLYQRNFEIKVEHESYYDNAEEVRTIYDVMADESYAIATSDEEGGEE